MQVPSFESDVRKEQWQREQAAKQQARETKSNLKDVNITSTAESEIRKEQFNREQGWKQAGRETKHNLKDVNMAVSFMFWLGADCSVLNELHS